MGKRIDDSSAMVSASVDARAGLRVALRFRVAFPSRVALPSGDRGAAGLRAARPHDRDRTRLDVEDQPAVGACIDGGWAAQAAHRPDDRKVFAALLAMDRAARVDQAVLAAERQAGREDRLAAGTNPPPPRPFGGVVCLGGLW